jgi:hypothetical protein
MLPAGQSKTHPKHCERNTIVHIRANPVSMLLALLATGAAALAIAAAPSVLAAPNEPTCADTGALTQCQGAGNVQIYTTPPAMAAPNKFAYGPFEGYHHGRS